MSRDREDLPPQLRPFVLPTSRSTRSAPTRSTSTSRGRTPAPAVLMVHGGPVRPDRAVRPPDWPAFRAYGALPAQAGLVAATSEHGFVDEDSLGVARDDVRSTMDLLRARIRASTPTGSACGCSPSAGC
jgi:hypothetical protein